MCERANGRSGWQQRPSLFVRCFAVASAAGGAIRSHADILGNRNAITSTLQAVDKQFTSGVDK